MLNIEDRIQRLEWTLRGPNGDNGLVAEVRGLRQELHEWREQDAKRREIEQRELKQDRRWRIGTALAIITAIVGAAGIVASALPG